MIQHNQPQHNAPAAHGAQGGAQPAAPLTFKGQGPGEVVSFILRPHWLWYVFSSWRVVLLILVTIGMFLLAQVMGFYGVPVLVFWGIIVVLGIFHLARWVSDDLNTWLFRRYILTDWRVIDDKGVVANEREVASIQRIQNVEVVRKNIFYMLFDLGDVEVMTAGKRGNLMLEGVHHPHHVAQLIRTEQLNHGDKWAAKPVPIRVPALRSLWEEIDAIDDPPPPNPTPASNARQDLPIHFLPGEVVLECIRRHWFNYVERSRGGIIIILVGVGLSFLYDAGGPTAFEPLRWILLFGSIILGGLWMLAVWFNYADDYLILTTSRVIRLERLYSFLADSTVEISYRKIQDVYTSLNPIGVTFGFGTLIVEAAGQAEPLIMTYMPNPLALEDRIYARQDFAEGRSERTRRRLRRREVGRWMAMMMNAMYSEVPDLRNLSVADAARLTRSEGLRLVVGGERRIVGMPPGLVVDQSPHPGSTAMRENEIRVVLSGTP